ncbi:MAG: hypothetical protein R3C01_14000 [Planctomycetaceae bacterium]
MQTNVFNHGPAKLLFRTPGRPSLGVRAWAAGHLWTRERVVEFARFRRIGSRGPRGPRGGATTWERFSADEFRVSPP